MQCIKLNNASNGAYVMFLTSLKSLKQKKTIKKAMTLIFQLQIKSG